MKSIFKDLKSEIFEKSIIQIYGNGEVLAEGCGQIKIYTEDKIVFCAQKCVEIYGEGLVMNNLGCGYVSIRGKITDIKFGEVQ